MANIFNLCKQHWFFRFILYLLYFLKKIHQYLCQTNRYSNEHPHRNPHYQKIVINLDTQTMINKIKVNWIVRLGFHWVIAITYKKKCRRKSYQKWLLLDIFINTPLHRWAISQAQKILMKNLGVLSQIPSHSQNKRYSQ